LPDIFYLRLGGRDQPLLDSLPQFENGDVVDDAELRMAMDGCVETAVRMCPILAIMWLERNHELGER